LRIIKTKILYFTSKIENKKYRFLNHSFLSNDITFNFLVLEPNQRKGLDKLKSHVKTNKKEKVVHENYWIGYYPFNKMRGEFVHENRKIQIELLDENCNQQFDDRNIDKIFLRYKNNQGIEIQDNWKIRENQIIQTDEQSYRILEIDSKRGSIVLTSEENQNRKSKYHEGDNVKQLRVRTLNKEQKSLGQVMGSDKIALIYFWGTWCAPCKSDFPLLKEIHMNYMDDVEIIAIAKDSANNVKKYIRQNKIIWKNVLATESILSSLNISSYPTLILLNSDGVIMHEKVNIEQIRDLIK